MQKSTKKETMERTKNSVEKGRNSRRRILGIPGPILTVINRGFTLGKCGNCGQGNCFPLGAYNGGGGAGGVRQQTEEQFLGN
jgi:hypothetical protein